MDEFVFKISKDGKSVESEESTDFVINSDFKNMFTFSINTGIYVFSDSSFGAGTVNMITTTHNLGYIPSYIGYVSEDNNNYAYMPLWYYSKTGSGWRTEAEISIHCDKNKLYIDFVKTVITGSPPSDATAWKNMNGTAFQFKYYIFANELF